MMNKKNIKILDGAKLKYIAMASMLIDHVNKGILNSLIIIKGYEQPWLLTLNNIFEILGRIAFPIFLFLLVEGFLHTRSRRNYFLYLIVFGFLAEIPYDMFESAEFVDMGGQNMYFTLALALLTLCIVEWIRKKIKGAPGLILAVFAGLILSYCSAYLALDYTFYGILIPLVIYLLKDRRPLGLVAGYLIVLKELWSILGFAAIALYNGERGRINKWFCYAFYPLHLLIIGLIRIYVLKC